MAVGMAVATMGRDDAAAGEECAGSDELPDEAWREITVAEGSQGPRSYMFSAQRVRVTRKGKPGEGHGLSTAATWTAASPQCWRLWRAAMGFNDPGPAWTEDGRTLSETMAWPRWEIARQAIAMCAEEA